MKDEIKEILDFLKDKDDYIEEYCYEYKRISLEDTKILIDYITNLQEENEELKKNQRYHKKFGNDYIFELQERIEKAIDYIKINICDIKFMKKEYGKHLTDFEVDTTFNDIEKLLNILQGFGNDG